MNLSVARGELLAVMGPSGCGKSTLLNMLGALDQPTAGEVWVAGENLARLKHLDEFRARTVGFVFQLHNLLPTLTALENVEVPMQGRVARAGERRKRATALLQTVGLPDRLNALPGQLSGGQRQRVAVAPLPWPIPRRCCWLTSRPAAWTARAARRFWIYWPT